LLAKIVLELISPVASNGKSLAILLLAVQVGEAFPTFDIDVEFDKLTW